MSNTCCRTPVATQLLSAESFAEMEGENGIFEVLNDREIVVLL
jgi:hypothetical protein